MAKIDLKSIIDDAGKTAADLASKAQNAVSKAVDVNGDGKFDFEDIKGAAESVGSTAQRVADNLKTAIAETDKANKEKARNRRIQADLKELNPIFPESIGSLDFSLSNLIRITDPDKKHAESEACKGSIGYITTTEGLTYVNIYRDNADQFGLSFYPDKESEMYYVNPVDRDHYISLEEYFRYLKIVRINELQRIAQDLGAKFFSVKYIEIKKDTSLDATKAKAKAGPVKAEVEHESKSKNLAHTEIAAEMECLGHAPVEPKLHYLAKDAVVQNLVSLRLRGEGMKRNKYTIKLSDSSGIKIKDAVKIEGAIKKNKLSGGLSIVSEATKESNSFFEYEIEY